MDPNAGPQIILERHGAGGRYRLEVDGHHVGELDFVDAEGQRHMTHTGVHRSHRNLGLAAQLARRALDDARTDHVAVVPSCSYIADFIDRHPEYGDLVAR